jgi:hypothetical protein
MLLHKKGAVPNQLTRIKKYKKSDTILLLNKGKTKTYFLVVVLY